MNKRDFLATLAKAAAGFAILPAANTYKRVWHKTAENIWMPNPDWVNAPYEITMYINWTRLLDRIEKNGFTMKEYKRWQNSYLELTPPQ